METQTKIHCPSCGMELLEFTYQGIRIDQCVHCEGVWLDAGELERVAHARKSSLLSIELAIKQAEAEVREKLLKPEEAAWMRKIHSHLCPRCQAALTRVDYRQIPVDRCHACGGVWLDSAEFEKVAGAERGIFKALHRFIHGE